jgi:collagenase-like PrtC family protease
MDFVVACNWDERLVEVAARYGVKELFGKLDRDVVGGGRASYILPAISRRNAEKYIRKVQEQGIAFNYLLNGTCLGNREMTRQGINQLRSLIDWASDAGVRWFTVSIPFVAQVLRRRVPDVHIVVSMMAGVESVEAARYWEETGAEVVILFNVKDFPFIKALKAKTGLKVEVAANLSCMNRCYQAQHHGNTASHASNPAGVGSYCLPLNETRCAVMKVEEPRRIVAGQWVRPEDLHVYESMGVERLKILDRISPTEHLERCLEAYSKRAYDGNLALLIPGYRQDRVDGYTSAGRLARTVRAFLRPGTYNVLKAPRFARRNRPPAFVLDNRALDGYLDGFLKRDCRNLSCKECGYCDRIAKKAVRFEPGERERFLADGKRNLEELETGSFFTYGPGEWIE